VIAFFSPKTPVALDLALAGYYLLPWTWLRMG
jgi:hypothetical protein